MAGDGNEARYPLTPLVKAWVAKIKLATKFKKSHFQDQADEAMKFYECGQELSKLMYDQRPIDDDDPMPAPKFRMIVGKVAEIVELFGPSLYHRNPTIRVEPKTLDIPIELLMAMVPPEMMQQAQQAAQMQGQQFNPQSLFPPDPSEPANKITSLLLEYYLDYIQRENDKKTHSRRAIDETLIKGMGILWSESFRPFPGAPVLVGSFYDTVDNLVVDPDADTIEDALWIARKYNRPIWEVAEEYGIDEDMLGKKYGSHESAGAQADREQDPDGDRKRKVGKTNDLIEYWKVYSKMGMGHKLSDAKNLEDLDDLLDSFGDNVMLVIAEKVPYPLNFSHKNLKKWTGAKGEAGQEKARKKIFMDCQWPIPFWADGSWPFTQLAFHEVPNNPWPMSHVKPALGYLKFINWAMSFLSNKIRTSCRTLIAAAKALEDDWLQKLASGKDYEQLEVPQALMNGGAIEVNRLIAYIQPPPFQADIWKVLEAVFDLFDKATGLTELAYGASGGMRSAEEAKIKEGNRSVRPDDMANKVEDWLSLVARKEAMAARWLLDEETVKPIVGDRNAALWEKYVMSGDIVKVAREFNYRIEAGSARKPNKETQIQTINAAIQAWGPILFPYVEQTGNVQIINAFLQEWCKANDIESKPFLLPPPPPPPPNPMQQKIEAEIEQGKQELEMKKEEMGMKLQMEQQKGQMQLQAQQAKTQADVESAKLKMQVDLQKAQMEMQIKQQQSQQDLQLGQAKMHGEMQMAQQKVHMEGQMGQQKMALQKQQGDQQMALADRQGSQEMQLEQQKGQVEQAKGHQQLQLQAKQGQQQLKLGEQAHAAKIKQGSEQSKAKVQQTKAQAAAKPKPKPKPKGKK